MKILAYVHTWNDADVIGIVLNAIRRQTKKIEEILIVDNGSTDGTAELDYPPFVTVIRHPLNLGTSGAVKTGFEYALAHGYEWMWILDADSVPRPDALELLTSVIQTNTSQFGVVSTSHNLLALGQMLCGRVLTPGGPRLPRQSEERSIVECDGIIWSGALINLAAVEQVGPPRSGSLGYWQDLSLDYGDIEYGYRISRAGYRIVVHRDSIIDHPVGRGLHARLLGCRLYSTNHSASRRYLYFRNLVFFWLRLYHQRNWPLLLIWFSYRLSMIVAGIILLEDDRRVKLTACMKGIYDGFRGQLGTVYSGRH